MRNYLSKQLAVVLSCIILLSLVSCNSNVIYSKYIKLPDNDWAKDNKLTYEVDIADNTISYDVYLAVRHADSYPYNNLFVFLNTTYPDAKSTTDTLECILANEKGEWKGEGAGDIWDNKIPLKKGVKFPQTGKYTFTFEQAMRNDPLPLIMDFGIVIEKSK